MKRFFTLLLVVFSFIGCQIATDEYVASITRLSTAIPSSEPIRQTSTLAPTSAPTEILTLEPTFFSTERPTQLPPLPSATPPIATTTSIIVATAVQPTVTAVLVTQPPPTSPPATEPPTAVPPTAIPPTTVPSTTIPPTTVPPTTVPPTPTLLPASPTAAPTSIPTPVVNYFRFAAPLSKPSQPAMLEWDVQGVSSVTISRNGGEWAEAGQQWIVSNHDSMEHTFPTSVGGWPITYLLTSIDAPNLQAEFTVTVPCEYEWAFSFDYPGNTCPIEPLISAAAFQPFEDGFMVWTEELDQILYSTWDGFANGEVTDTFDAANDPISFPSIQPPAGYLQPEYGFGKLWRDDDSVRQMLGWAVAQPSNFTTIRQSEPGSRYGDYQAFIGLPDEHLITINVPDPIWSVSYPKPNIPRAEQRPPIVIIDPTPPPSDGIVVNYLRFATEPTKPSDGAILEWDVSGVNSVTIIRSGGEWNEAQVTYEVTAAGTMPQSFIPELGGWPIFYVLTACNGDYCVEETFTAELPCEYPVLITAAADSTRCLSAAIVSNGSQQNFENGFMIWIESQDVIIYSTWSGLTNGEVVDTFEHGVDPIRDESLVPPDGLYQPEYGFGKVWREVAGVRDLLGWATDWGTSYTVIRQNEPIHRYGFTEWITLNNGGLITINHPDPIWIIE